MDGEALERFYQESLEERIIAYLSKLRNISLEEAMNIYYHSRLADKIHCRKEYSIWITRYLYKFCVKRN